LQITPSLAKVLLHAHEWAIQDIIVKYRGDSCKLLVVSKIKPPHTPEPVAARHLRHQVCPVCVASQSSDRFSGLACGHLFCKECWTMHFEVQITQGISTGKY
jgi:ariadne-2